MAVRTWKMRKPVCQEKQTPRTCGSNTGLFGEFLVFEDGNILSSKPLMLSEIVMWKSGP